MIADCETCERKSVPCSGCEESQRTICFICQGDIADPYCEIEPIRGFGWDAGCPACVASKFVCDDHGAST